MCCSTFEVRPGRSGDKSESHRTVRTPTNKTSEALVRRQGTYDLLTEPLTVDQLCRVRSDNAAARNCLRGLERHITGIATKRHRSTGVSGSDFVLDCGGSREQAARFQDLLQQPSHPYLNRRANAESAWVTTNRKSPLVSMATSLSILISDTSGCVISEDSRSLRYPVNLGKTSHSIIWCWRSWLLRASRIRSFHSNRINSP